MEELGEILNAELVEGCSSCVKNKIFIKIWAEVLTIEFFHCIIVSVEMAM